MLNADLNQPSPEPSFSARGFLGALGTVLFWCLVLAAFIAALVWLQGHAGLEFESGYWAGAGILLLILTLKRPNWFWNHPKATFVREILGDLGTSIAYCGVALLLFGTSAYRQVAITHARRVCAAEVAASSDVHARVRALYGAGATGLPRLDRSTPSAMTCERLLTPR